MDSGNYHLLVAGHKFEQIWAKIGSDLLWESNSIKLVRITIDNQLKFENHISHLILSVFFSTQDKTFLLHPLPSRLLIVGESFQPRQTF